ncbi:UNVERIFIED_CONTAM: hypothetical protein RF648_19095, partial [Kocuria sp. CPCC 205274]
MKHVPAGVIESLRRAVAVAESTDKKEAAFMVLLTACKRLIRELESKPVANWKNGNMEEFNTMTRNN